MTVKQLIRRLRQLPDDAPVVIPFLWVGAYRGADLADVGEQTISCRRGWLGQGRRKVVVLYPKR